MLDLRWPDPVAGRGDHVMLAADVPEVAVAILHAEIAGQQELAGILLRGGFRIFPVLEHGARVRLAHADDAALAARQFFTAVIDDADLETRRGPPHRARSNRKQPGIVANHEVAIGLAITLMGIDAEGRADPLQ